MKTFAKPSNLIPAPKLIFFLILFFLPQQFGPHFWPGFSYVHGIRVDYLSPSIYISDVLIFILLLLSFKQVLSSRLTRSFITSKLFLLFMFVIFTPLFYAKSPPSLLFGAIKLFEFGFVGLFIATQIKKHDLPHLIGVLALTGGLESVLAVIQFFKQSSVEGFLYFFGERTYNLSTIGIAAMNTANGLMVRPYGTFPHPNVLAFFLFTVIVLVTYRIKLERNKNIKVLLSLSFAMMQLGLLLTFSRVIILINILFLLYVFLYIPFQKKIITKKRTGAVLLGGIFFALYLLLYNLRFFDLNYLIKDLIPRSDLVQVSFSILKNYPIFGLGIDNFLYYQADLQKHFVSYYLQPVHNIFLLFALQTGIVGIVLFGYFLLMSVLNVMRQIKKNKESFTFAKAVLILLISIIISGLFDHYFLTVQQGQLLLVLIFGLSWSKFT